MTHRICIISTVHQPFDTRIFHKQAQTLARAGYEVMYLVSHSRDEVIDGIEIRRLERGTLVRRLLSLPAVFRKALATRADVFHLHDPELIILALWLRLAGRQVIYDAHEDIAADIPYKDYLARPVAIIIAFFAALLEKTTARLLNAVITATPAIAEGFRGKNVYVVNNFPELDPDQPRAVPQFTQQGLRLIYIGDMTPVRGILEIVQAVTQIDPGEAISLDIIGKFPFEDYEKLVRDAADERVQFKGWLAYNAAMAALQQADTGMVCFFPLPNHTRAQPNKLFEYMMAGLPMIVSDFPLWRQIVIDNGCGFGVDPQDPASIADALLRMRRLSAAERREMGKRGQQLVYDRYNWNAEAKTLLSIYEKLIGKPGT
jgi:glycosyltransferase involved in cell wall biosynthesis